MLDFAFQQLKYCTSPVLGVFLRQQLDNNSYETVKEFLDYNLKIDNETINMIANKALEVKDYEGLQKLINSQHDNNEFVDNLEFKIVNISDLDFEALNVLVAENIKFASEFLQLSLNRGLNFLHEVLEIGKGSGCYNSDILAMTINNAITEGNIEAYNLLVNYHDSYINDLDSLLLLNHNNVELIKNILTNRSLRELSHC